MNLAENPTCFGLDTIGGFEIGAIAGLILGAASPRIPASFQELAH